MTTPSIKYNTNIHTSQYNGPSFGNNWPTYSVRKNNIVVSISKFLQLLVGSGLPGVCFEEAHSRGDGAWSVFIYRHHTKIGISFTEPLIQVSTRHVPPAGTPFPVKLTGRGLPFAFSASCFRSPLSYIY